MLTSTRLVRRALTQALLALLLSTAGAQAEDIAETIPASIVRGKVSIIIDDLGYKLSPGKHLATLPYPLTLAIIPFTPYGSDIAQLAAEQNKEVMLHAPMEPLNAGRWEAGLTARMDAIEILATVEGMLNDIPHVKGVNNHGGSRFTQDRERMSAVMAVLASRHLYFIDSRTIASSLAAEAADGANIPYSERDVFLDNEKSAASIRQQLVKLRDIALSDGQAIGIGHPYPETFRALLEELPYFTQQGIAVVSASELVSQSTPPTASIVGSDTLTEPALIETDKTPSQYR